MSQPTATTDRRTRRLSGRARTALLGGAGLAAAVAAAVVISGAAGALAAGEHPAAKPVSIVQEGSGASDGVGATSTDPVTGVTVIDGDMLIAPESQVVQDTFTGSGGDTAGSGAGAVPTDLHTVAPSGDAASALERDVVTSGGAEPAQGPASIVAEGSGASDATDADPDAGVQVTDGDMLVAPETTGTY